MVPSSTAAYTASCSTRGSRQRQLLKGASAKRVELAKGAKAHKAMAAGIIDESKEYQQQQRPRI